MQKMTENVAARWKIVQFPDNYLLEHFLDGNWVAVDGFQTVRHAEEAMVELIINKRKADGLIFSLYDEAGTPIVNGIIPEETD